MKRSVAATARDSVLLWSASRSSASMKEYESVAASGHEKVVASVRN
jgi:hypothetical protein